ncbi:MAG: T9SS type A sorting domain-containing protein, partial [Candidatus Cloacimonetes bacterium]|nr:T9SS type A sorting domain-containing protein [Candidatus Cloacimonadota bacterium]
MQIRKKSDIQTGVNDKATEQQETTRDLVNYLIFLDGIFVTNLNESEYQFDLAGFTPGQSYALGVKAAYEGGNSDLVTIDWTLTSTGKDDIVPVVTALNGNYPNPFNPETRISFGLKSAGQVTIYIYNAKGQRVRELINSEMEAGNHSVVWDGKGESGKAVKSGVFFYRMKTNRYTSTKKMILMK